MSQAGTASADPAAWAPREIPLLSDAECAAVRDAVMALEGEWTRRHPAAPFFTLGAASYLDAVPGVPRDTYGTRCRSSRPILENRFRWLYDRVCAALAGCLGEPVGLSPDHAVPGFHVFQAHPAWERPSFSIHSDLQYALLDWPEDAAADFSNPISFTLPIALPRSGAGLLVWPLGHDDLAGLSPGERKDRIAAREPALHRYAAGRLVMHSGHTLHQIAPASDLGPGDDRITLQGHGVRCGDGWRIYW